MAPKKKAAAKAPAKASAKSTGPPEVKWLEKQLEVLQSQADGAEPWLQDAHAWHEERLREILERFQSGAIASLPDDFRDGVEFYTSQLADGQSVSQEAFYDDRELYSALLEVKAEAAEEVAYQRAADSEEALLALEKVKAWSETSPHGISNFAKLLKALADSASVQEAGLTRLGALASGTAGGYGAAAPAGGLAPATLLPIIFAAMTRFEQDPQVQRQGCSALRALALQSPAPVLDAGGAKKIAEVMKRHIRNAEVCRTAAVSFAAIVNKCQNGPVEMSQLRNAGAAPVLVDILSYHSNDLQLDKVARQTLPFLKG